MINFLIINFLKLKLFSLDKRWNKDYVFAIGFIAISSLARLQKNPKTFTFVKKNVCPQIFIDVSCNGILLSKFLACMRFQKAITYLSHSKCAIHAGRKFLCNNKTICSFNNLVQFLGEPEEKRSGMQNILIVALHSSF